jgi:nitrogen fixation-related uncharacterized protein
VKELPTRVVIVLIGIVILVFVLLMIVRFVWRVRNEQLEPGGSWGQQIFGRAKDEKPDDF